MRHLIDETLIKMNTNEFLSNIKKVFNDLFSYENIDLIYRYFQFYKIFIL